MRSERADGTAPGRAEGRGEGAAKAATISSSGARIATESDCAYVYEFVSLCRGVLCILPWVLPYFTVLSRNRIDDFTAFMISEWAAMASMLNWSTAAGIVRWRSSLSLLALSIQQIRFARLVFGASYGGKAK